MRLLRRAAGKLVLLWILGLLVACSDDVLSPEDEIRLFIEQGIEAAEERQVGELSDRLHPGYQDSRGNRAQQITQLLRAYFFRHRNIHLFTRIGSIELVDANTAIVKMHVAMAGSVIADVDALAALRAQIYAFELHLHKNETWLLQSARWNRASVTDLE